MSKKKLIIIGKKSFIGSNLYELINDKKNILLLNLDQFLRLKKIEINRYSYLCDCTDEKVKLKKINKNLSKNENKIINKIKDIDINYIFLSSRRVYFPKYNINEKSKVKPIDTYSKNKLITEKILSKLIRNRLLILRISNVIGFKKYDKYRKIHHTFFDNYLQIIKSNKKQEYVNFFKDFITIKQLAKVFSIILKNEISGIYNVSIGRKIFIKEMLGWLNTHNLNKKIFSEKKASKKYIKIHSFTLNNKKLCNKIKYKPNKNELKIFCEKISRYIHN